MLSTASADARTDAGAHETEVANSSLKASGHETSNYASYRRLVRSRFGAR